jgi:hypothetical protein
MAKDGGYPNAIEVHTVTIGVSALHAAKLMKAFGVHTVEDALVGAISVAIAASGFATDGTGDIPSRTCAALIRGARNNCG